MSERRRSSEDAVFARWALAFGVVTCAAVSAAEGLPDPTRPPAALAPKAPAETERRGDSLELRAVFFAEGRRIAIVNGRRLRVGDEIEGATVRAIGPGNVELVRGEERVRLELIDAAIRTENQSQTDPGPSPPRRDGTPHPEESQR